HIDTVPEGDITLWKHDPFDPVVEGDRIYGRGSEDNGGSMITSIYAGKAILDLGIEPKYTFGLALVADEEYGSRWGIDYLLDKGIFNGDDLILIPDAGNSEGNLIEIAEKSILWIEIEVLGRQAHASTPQLAKNALKKGAELLLKIDQALKEKFYKMDAIFEPPVSTFEPTKAEKTVDNVNTIPGRFVFYIDSRVLPEYNLDDVIELVREVVDRNKGDFEVNIRSVQRLDASAPTPVDSEVVVVLRKTIEKVRGIKPKVMGIGGGTCAAHFRTRGYAAVVWSTIDETAHQPNEYKRISHMVEDAKVFAVMAV
ncbi:MAG: M20 family metallo-hydrolase, partial [Thermotogaceae bacterium]|nr:M20 family metallo-hydrolase [Thermotogaceae bacterium]